MTRPSSRPAGHARRRTGHPLAAAWLASALALAALAPTAQAASPAKAPKPATALRQLESCHWDQPGTGALMGAIPAAVENLRDLPRDVRQRLARRMGRQAFDDFVTIRRDAITGRYRYAAQVTQLQRGNGSLCKTVRRDRWAPAQVVRALVYCEGSACVMVSTEPRHLALLTRLAESRLADAAPADEPDLLEGLPPTGAGPVAGTGTGVAAATQSFAPISPAMASFEQGAAGSVTLPGLLPGSLGTPVLRSIASGTGGAGDTGSGGGLGGGGGGEVPPPLAIPEPGMAVLWGAGLALLGAARRRRPDAA